MKAVSLWSGGKDSCFACYKAIGLGHQIAALFNFTDPGSKRSLSHGLPAGLIFRQAGLTGIPLMQKAMPTETYRQDFKALISAWKKEQGIEGIVFGDIYLKEHKDWLDEVCRELEVKAILPLWGRDTRELALEIISSGFEPVVVATRADVLGKEWLGRTVDKKFLAELRPGIDPCGENGEFHTLVTAGPIFKKGGISIEESKPVLREGTGKHWFLDITQFT